MFDACNLCCEFCYLGSHRSRPQRKIFSDAAGDFASYIPERIKNGGYEEVVVRLYGGEIFADSNEDWVYEACRELVVFIKSILMVPVKTKFISNCVFADWGRAESLLEETGSCLNMSYDPAGRYTDERMRRLAIKTGRHFIERGLLNEVTTLLTAQNIEAIVKGDAFLDSLGESIRVEFSDYVPNEKWEKCTPDAERLCQLYRWGVDNARYGIELFYDLMSCAAHETKEKTKFCSCDNTLIYVPAERRFINECVERNRQVQRQFGGTGDEVRMSSMLKETCVYCEYYRTCPMHCAKTTLFDACAGGCPARMLFESVTPEDVSRFEEWRKLHEDAARRS